MPRTVHSRLHLGNGEASLNERERLHGLLDEAFQHIGGSKRPLRSTRSNSTDYDDQVNRSTVFVRLVAEDLVCALLGDRARVLVE